MKERKKPEKFMLPHGRPSDDRSFAFSSRVPSKAAKIKALINYGIISLLPKCTISTSLLRLQCSPLRKMTPALHQRRLRIEHVNSSVKRCRIVKDRIRLWKDGVRDLVMELCRALHNFRVRLTPWQA